MAKKKPTGRKTGKKNPDNAKFANATSWKVGDTPWEKRNIHGRTPIFETPQDLWDAAVKYFQWIEDNPEKISEPVKFQGVGAVMEVPQKRNMSEDGLKTFLNICNQTWENYKEKPYFLEVTEAIVRVIRAHKMDGAISGQFNANIIARELGLADKQDVSHSGAITHVESEYVDVE